MRAASCRPRPGKRVRERVCLPCAQPSVPRLNKKPFSGISFLYSVAFLLGYFPGIFYGRLGNGDIGAQLAEYYLEPLHFSVWSDTFFNQISAAFLQLLFIVFCGFSAFGVGLLALFFLIKGAFLGLCAVNVLALGGSRGLVFYWLCVCLPSLLQLLVLLWLAGYAARPSIGLFQNAFCGGAPRGQLEASRRRFLVRCGTSLLFFFLFCILCSGLISGAVRLLVG